MESPEAHPEAYEAAFSDGDVMRLELDYIAETQTLGLSLERIGEPLGAFLYIVLPYERAVKLSETLARWLNYTSERTPLNI